MSTGLKIVFTFYNGSADSPDEYSEMPADTVTPSMPSPRFGIILLCMISIAARTAIPTTHGLMRGEACPNPKT